MYIDFPLISAGTHSLGWSKGSNEQAGKLSEILAVTAGLARLAGDTWRPADVSRDMEDICC